MNNKENKNSILDTLIIIIMTALSLLFMAIAIILYAIYRLCLYIPIIRSVLWTSIRIIVNIIVSCYDSINDIRQYVKQKPVSENIIIYLIKGFISREKRLFTIAILELVELALKPFLWFTKICYWFWSCLQIFFTKEFWQRLIKKLVECIKKLTKCLINWVISLCVKVLNRFVARAKIYSKFTFRDHDRIYLIIIFLIFLTIAIVRRMSLDIAWDFSAPPEAENAEPYVNWSYNISLDWNIHWIIRDNEFLAVKDYLMTHLFCFSQQIADALVEKLPYLAKSGTFQKMAGEIYAVGDRGLYLHTPPIERWVYDDGTSVYYCIYTKNVYVIPPLFRFGFWLPQVPSLNPDKFAWRNVVITDKELSYLETAAQYSPKIYIAPSGAKCIFMVYEFKIPEFPEDLTPAEAYQIVLNYSAHVVHEILQERFVYVGTHFTSSIDIEYEVLERMILIEKIPFIKHVLVRTKELYYTPCPVSPLVRADIEFKKLFIWWWKLSRLPWVYYGDNPPPTIEPALISYEKVVTVDPIWLNELSPEGYERAIAKYEEIVKRQSNPRIRDFRHQPLWPSQEFYYKNEPVYDINYYLPVQDKETLKLQAEKMGYPTEMVEKIYAYPELDFDKVYGVTKEDESSLETKKAINLENNNIKESEVLKNKKEKTKPK